MAKLTSDEINKTIRENPWESNSQMTWMPINKGLPKESGTYFVYAESAYPQKPFYGVAWFEESTGKWELLPIVWLEAISHWMLPKPPSNETNLP